MTGKLSLGLLATWVVAGVADTAVSLYGQCGGEGYAGATNCVSGAYCTSYNAWYYQCVPGTAAATATSAASTPVSVSATTTATSGASSAPAASVKYFISFGDSYSQTGFNVSLTKPAAGNPLGNPPLPGWTASGGLNWVGFLVSQFNASTLLSYNFAYGGATTNASLVTPFQSTVLSFIDQVTEFSNSIGVTPRPSYAPWTADNTLVGVWMGVNDVGNAWYNSDVPTLLGKIMDSYFGQLQILYKAGARNFVLLSVPPTYETPYMEGFLTTAQLGTLNTTIAEYNTLIATRLAAFTQANSGVNAKIVDTTVPFNTAINNPTAYGAPNATCYNSDGTSCLWFNDYHPGIAINKLVAQAVAASWKGSFFK